MFKLYNQRSTVARYEAFVDKASSYLIKLITDHI